MSLPCRFIRLLYLLCFCRFLPCPSQVYPLPLPPLIWYLSSLPSLWLLTQLQNRLHQNILRSRELYLSYACLHLLQPILPRCFPQGWGYSHLSSGKIRVCLPVSQQDTLWCNPPSTISTWVVTTPSNIYKYSNGRLKYIFVKNKKVPHWDVCICFVIRMPLSAEEPL